MAVDFSSPTYPYERVLTGALTFKGAENIPYRLLRYLLDLPDGNGYTPPDDNAYPRCRLMKYLWYDGAKPLDHPLPGAQDKLSLLFDPDNPAINTDAERERHPKGYRMFMQRVIGQSQLRAESFLKCYVDHVQERRKFVSTIGVTMEIWCNVNFQTNSRTWAYDRSWAMEQCVREALDGVNMTGIGTVSFCAGDSPYNGSSTVYDEANNVGRAVRFSIAWHQ